MLNSFNLDLWTCPKVIIYVHQIIMGSQLSVLNWHSTSIQFLIERVYDLTVVHHGEFNVNCTH
jgi:hypothetical protein